jgi:acetoin utilization deacetylase AcuC-like enzyme
MSSARVPLYFCDHHHLPLPEGHKFPTAKYRMVRELLCEDSRFEFREAPLATEHDLRRVHDEAYIQGFLQGTLAAGILRRIGFPWSEGLVKRTLASTGGTLAATRAALETGIAGTVAGGTHHAFRSEGSGFCVFNDLAVSAEWARQCRGLSRIAVVDLDVHQGDGTASIFADDEGVFTLSLHGARNFPFRKQRSRLDVEFADGAQGEQYFPALGEALDRVWAFEPELVLFQSGVDGLAGDRLGRLSLTFEDLAVRDQMVLSGAQALGVPIVVTMGGGYSDPIMRTAEAHAQTFLTAAAVFTASRTTQ